MNNQDNDKTVRKESVPPMSSGTHEQGGPLLETGMMQPPQTPGTLGMIGKYQVVRVLGEGGMGQVLLAREPVTDSLVAVKIIKPEYLKKEWAVHRFLTEARHMFKMSHPSIIRVHEVSDRPEGPFFVMPYMAGGSLAQKIKPGEALPADTIQPLARQVAEALQYAHGRGIIHRDLKTSNILLDPEGRAYLCDFGLLRTVFNDSMVDVTKPQVEGTVPYMSPAIAGGKAEDTRCDIYAFGCLLYEMLTGQPPYQGPTVDAILKQIQAGPPQPIRQLNPQAPARLVAIAEHAMGRELRDRYSTMADVINDLDRAAQGKEPLGPHGRANGSHLRRNVLAVLGIVALLGLAAFGLSKLPGLINGSATATLEDQFTWITTNGAITITKYTGPGGAVTIPSTISGLPVTSLGVWAFRGSRLTRVTIPSSVISIGHYVAAWASNPFFDCRELNSVVVDRNNAVFSSSADGVLFDKAKTCLVCYPGGKVGSYVIPDSVKSIAESAFAGCSKLTTLTIPSGVTTSGFGALGSCDKLTGVYFKGNAPAFAWNAFGGTTNATIYYQPGTIGWGKEFGGLPTAPWNPQASNAASPAATAQTPFTCTTNNGAITLAYYTGSDVAVTIPRTINGLPVTRIGDRAFENWGNTGLASVTIPDSVTVIGSYAFAGRSSLTNVTIPNSVTNLGAWVFCGCPSLTSINIPASVTSMGSNPFHSCGKLRSIMVDAANPVYCSSADGVVFNKEKTCLVFCPGGRTGNFVIANSISSIGEGAFVGCNLTSVTIPGSVTNIGAWAFASCKGLASITIPDSVRSIQYVTFKECSSLTNIVIPNSVTSIGYEAFLSCSSLPKVTVPASVTSIEVSAFRSCGMLASIEVDLGNPAYSSTADGVLFNKDKTALIVYPPGKAGNFEISSSAARIGPAAFKECPYVTSVTIPESVTDIGAEAFRKCENLTAVYFKGNAPRLGKDVFEDNPKLKVYYLSDKTGWGGEFGGRPTKVWSGQASSAAALMPPLPPVILPASRASLAALRGEFDWTVNNNAVTVTKYKGQGGAVVIPSQINGLPVTVIGDWSFRDCVALTSVTIPDSVTAIGAGAFHSCAGLTGVRLPGNVATIGGYPFAHCTGLTAFEVDAANPAFTSVDGVVFDKAKTRLVLYPAGRRGDYQIPAGVAVIGWSSFEGSDKLTGVTLPDSVMEIGWQSFKNCTRLAQVNISQGVTRIGDNAFEGCASLSKLSLPKSLVQIGWNPFHACTNLVAVEVDADSPHFVSKDGVLFDKAGTRLISYPGGRNGSYDVPKGVSVIGAAAFTDCRLTSVTMPNGVTSVEDRSFYGCSRLASVTLPPSLTTIGFHAFNECSSLASITIPESVTTIADAAFANCTKLASIRFPSRITRIAPWMCYNCQNLTAVTIPVGVTSIGEIAFNSCSKLERITIPNSVTEIGNSAFEGCSKLASMAIPDSVVKIGDRAFYNCQRVCMKGFSQFGSAMGDKGQCL